MNILVTGGGGFVGRNLVKALINLGHKVSITSTGNEPVVEDVTKTYYTGLGGIDYRKMPCFDALIHLMANNDTLCSDEEEMFRLNVDEPRELFYQIKAKGCKKFIYASSTAVYGSQPAPYQETVTKILPLNCYGKSKALFDNFAMEFSQNFSLPVFGLRYCNIYGPGEENKGRRMSMIGHILRNVINDQQPKLFEYGEQKRDWVYVDDVVLANLLALNSSIQGGIYNIGSGTSHTFNEILVDCNKITSKSIQATYVPCPFSEAYQNHTECDISKAKKELGYNPQFSLSDGIKEYAKNLFTF